MIKQPQGKELRYGTRIYLRTKTSAESEIAPCQYGKASKNAPIAIQRPGPNDWRKVILERVKGIARNQPGGGSHPTVQGIREDQQDKQNRHETK
jgi:hypothetical protein